MDTPQAHIRLECHVRGVCVSTAQKWALLPQQPFSVLNQGIVKTLLKTLYDESVLSIFRGAAVERCVYVCVLGSDSAELDSNPWFL